MSTPEVVSNGVTFEVERFEWVGDRLEVTGRWYGLRGHRFVRPVLVVQAAGDEQRRLLALLDHKPWAAEDGDEWIAAFPWEGDPVGGLFASAEGTRVLQAERQLDPQLAWLGLTRWLT